MRKQYGWGEGGNHISVSTTGNKWASELDQNVDNCEMTLEGRKRKENLKEFVKKNSM